MTAASEWKTLGHPTELWDRVEKTDPNYVKEIKGKSYGGNSPSPYYLVRKATEVFGPCGIGWGFDIVEERLIEGHNAKIHHARVAVWYDWNGKRGRVEHVGQTTFSGVRNNGNLFTDEDAPKKSITDALTKALSMLGFAGDIFMGRWDDNRYVAQLEEEYASRQPAVLPAAPGTPIVNDSLNISTLDLDSWNALVREAESFPQNHTWPECLAWWQDNLPKLEKIKEKDGIAYSRIHAGFVEAKQRATQHQ